MARIPYVPSALGDEIAAAFDADTDYFSVIAIVDPDGEAIPVPVSFSSGSTPGGGPDGGLDGSKPYANCTISSASAAVTKCQKAALIVIGGQRWAVKGIKPLGSRTLLQLEGL